MTYTRRLVTAGIGSVDYVFYELPFSHGLMFLHDIIFAEGEQLRWVTPDPGAGRSFLAAWEEAAKSHGV